MSYDKARWWIAPRNAWGTLRGTYKTARKAQRQNTEGYFAGGVCVKGRTTAECYAQLNIINPWKKK